MLGFSQAIDIFRQREKPSRVVGSTKWTLFCLIYLNPRLSSKSLHNTYLSPLELVISVWFTTSHLMQKAAKTANQSKFIFSSIKYWHLSHSHPVPFPTPHQQQQEQQQQEHEGENYDCGLVWGNGAAQSRLQVGHQQQQLLCSMYT